VYSEKIALLMITLSSSHFLLMSRCVDDALTEKNDACLPQTRKTVWIKMVHKRLKCHSG